MKARDKEVGTDFFVSLIRIPICDRDTLYSYGTLLRS